MSAYIPEEIIEEIRASCDIVSVVADYVRLKKQGRNFTGLCPFHNEKTPSFMVSPEKQIFHCFGCGEGGNVITFVMKRENVSFPEAARMLAARVGIIIPEGDEDPARRARIRLREQAYEINELVKDFYQYVLKKHESAAEARKYLERRGITPQTVDSFQLGFAPPSWDSLLQFLTRKGYQANLLEQLGLVLPKTKGTGYYDRFRNRIMFPVWNPQGKVVGFGGRVLDDSLPKYLNSPETILFNKSHLLYAINKAAESIRRLDQVILVEGYLDVITCHQVGVTNVVASLGTAFTREQGKLIQRYTRDVVIAYDTDAAGVSATMRGWQVLDEIGCRVRLVSIPDGKDPDEFVRNQGADRFLEIIRNNTMTLCEYKTERAMEKFDVYSLEGKFKIASEVIPHIRNMSNEIEKDEAILNLAQRLHLSPAAIRAEVEKNARKSRNSWGNRDKITNSRNNNSKFALQAVSPETDARTKAEEVLMVLMLADRDVFCRVRRELGVHFSQRPEYLNIINLLHEMVEKGSDYQPAALFDRLQDQATAGVLSSLTVRPVPVGDRDRIIRDCLKTIREDELRKKREDLLRRMEDADRQQDQELRNQLLREYARLIGN